MQALLHYLNLYFEIALFRRAPQDLPASSTLLYLSLLLYAVVSFAAMSVQLPRDSAMLQALADTGLMAAFTWGVLAFRSRQPRFPQTLCALAGTGIVLGLIAIPVLAWLLRLGDPADANGVTPAAVVPSLLLLFLMGWSIAVVAFIFRHALEVSRGIGVSLAVAYLVLSFALSNLLLALGGDR
jgi:hypothetical protein